MGRRKAQPLDGRSLFTEQERVQTRRIRRQRALFIPRFLREAASSALLRTPERDRAREQVLRWADLETRGHLPKYNETSIDTQFLDQIFGEGLGYVVKTTSPEAWQLEHKFSVPGVGTADAALGEFPASRTPVAVVELKGALVDLDRDRSGGRTAVQQCWDYLNAFPGCPWGIVSNFGTIRLYHREKGTLAYEEFTLQELRQDDRFEDFYCLFERGGLLRSRLGQPPRALDLLKRTTQRQKEVGDELYESYRWRRLELIEHLHRKEGKPLDAAIRIAQKLLDRVLFIAFCEDRDLLPEKTLETAKTEIRTYSRAANPAWENFLDLFAAIDQGASTRKRKIDAFNGGLFADDPEINALQLVGERWTNAFAGFGTYDFSEEVNVEVLGHLFERSITELEKLRVGGLFALKGGLDDGPANGSSSKGARPTRRAKSAASDDAARTRMPKSAQRKRFGIYYTPPAFTGLIVERTVDSLVRERFAKIARKHRIDPEARDDAPPARRLAFWTDCLADLKSVTVCDPACGSGAFLIRAYDALDAHYKTVVHGLAGAGLPQEEVDRLEGEVPDLILERNLYGVDLSAEAVEITQLALWIRSARKGHRLSDLTRNVVRGNSLVADPAVDPLALDWHAAFPGIYGPGRPGGFSCVIGNPPWERVKVQDREFFSLADPETAEAVSAADRRKRIAAMPEAHPALHAAYLSARAHAQRLLDYAHRPEDKGGRYPLTSNGDTNLYSLFAELAASHLVAPDGIAGLLVPSGIATDDTTKRFFGELMDSQRLVSLFDFENRLKVFEDVDGRFKFSALVFGGRKRTTKRADFVFFAHGVEETAESEKQRHIPLTAADMALFNPNTRTCPIFRTRRDATLVKAVYKRIPVLVDRNRRQGGNPWGLAFFTMFHQTNDAEHFREAKVWKKEGFKLRGNVFVKAKRRALPLYEAKMVQAFDHRAASVVVEDENWVRQGQKDETSLVQHQNPEFGPAPRWWVDEATVDAVAEGRRRDWLLAYKDVTSPTNERTMIAAFVPWTAVVNSAPLILPDVDLGPRRECCLLANLNSFVLDYVARQKVGGVHLNFFIVEQLPILPPDAYAAKCPWSKRETLERWISDRVLKLSCTAEDLIPLASACGFAGSRGDGVHRWDDAERAEIRAELDAAFFRLYGLQRSDVEHVLSTFTGTGLQTTEGQDTQQLLWEADGRGARILAACDRLGSA